MTTQTKTPEYPHWRQALQIAADWHPETRKGDRGVPYLTHLLTVSSTVWEDGGDETAAIAALLHDSVEDRGKTHAEIAALFGPLGVRVADIVMACTDSGELEPGAQKGPYLTRKKEHLVKLQTKHHDDTSILQVTGADKLANLRTILGDVAIAGADYWGHFKGGLFYTHWYHEEIVRILEGGLGSERESRIVRALKPELHTLTQLRDATAATYAPVIRAITEALAERDPLGIFGAAPTSVLAPDVERGLLAGEATRRAVLQPDRSAREREVVTLLVQLYEPSMNKQQLDARRPELTERYADYTASVLSAFPPGPM